VDPIPDPLLLKKSGSARNQTWTSGFVARNSDHKTTEAVTTSRMNLKNGRRAGYSAYAQKGTTSMVTLVSRPEVSFLPDDSTSPENYEWLFASYNLFPIKSILIMISFLEYLFQISF
jgi:hypothetical protein